MRIRNCGLRVNTHSENALEVNGIKIIDKDGKIYGDIHAAAGSIGTTELADDGVTTAKIAAGAITVTELGTNAVETAKIKNDAVTADKLADNAVVTANIVAKNVTGAKIADKGVDTAQIADNAIEALQINANAVETDKIKDANVTLAKLATVLQPSHVIKFIVLGSTITSSTLVGLLVGDIVMTNPGNGPSTFATCVAEDTLPADPADTDMLIVFRPTA